MEGFNPLEKGFKWFDNVAVITLLSLLVVMSITYFLNNQRRREKSLPFPPGPWGFPIVGHLPMLGRNPVQTFRKYREKYGDIFSIQMGSYPTVVLNGTAVIKSAMTKNLDNFASRPNLYTNRLLQSIFGQTGIVFSEYGPLFKCQRQVAISALRKFVNYRTNPVEEIILGECRRVTDIFLRGENGGFDPKDEVTLAAGSIFYQILFGRHDNIREDRDYCSMVQNITDFVEFANAGNPADIMPWTRFFFSAKLQRFVNFNKINFAICSRQVDHHRCSFDPNHIRDVTDALIDASYRLTDEEKETGLTAENIMSMLGDLLGAGSETVGTTLLWLILYMVKFPEVQARVHAEIDEHIGHARLPTYKDRKCLPFVEAIFVEHQRIRTTVPLSIPHATTRDVELNGYNIPNNTFVLLNLASTGNDTNVWDEPEVFRPQRFLTNGTLDSSKAEMVLGFGAGRRRCLGEFIAKVELFVFFTYLLQHCSFCNVPGETYSLDSNFGLTLKPKPFKIMVKPRTALT